jgi:hypothetical protein
VAVGVAGVVAVGVPVGVAKNLKNARSNPWVLALLVLSLGTLVFLSFGGLAWLQTGAWPAPVWSFGATAFVGPYLLG